MNRSTPGLPVHHHLPEFTQTHVHRVGDAIQPSHPLSYPFPPAPNPSQHQSLFQWVGSSRQVTKVLELQLQHLPFHWIFRTDFLYNWLLWSPCSPRDSEQSSPTPRFKRINLRCLASFMVQLSDPYVTTGKTVTVTMWNFVSKVMPLLFNTISKYVIAFLPRRNFF